MYTTQMINSLTLSACSIQGARDDQQDSYLFSQHGKRTIAVVCDGMGGLEGGAIASKTAANMLLHDMEALETNSNMYSFYEKEIVRLDDAIYQLKNSDGDRLRAGTTIVSVMVDDEWMNWFSVGDSKLYYIRGKEMHCVTRQHNYELTLQQLVSENKITEEKYVSEAEKGEQLISYLGLGTAELFDGNYQPFLMKKGDRILLCTDGLYRTISDAEIRDILLQQGTTERICKMIENAVNSKKKINQDNATWILIQKNE